MVIPLLFWNDYFDSSIICDERFENHKFSKANNHLNVTSGDAYVFNCCFYGLTAKDGGGILYSVSKSYLLVEHCTLNNCTATRNTAGILVSGGNCIIAYVSSEKGFAGKNDGFCSINTDKERTINSVFDSSASKCEALIDYTLAQAYGHIHIKSVNLSHNIANQRSAISSAPNKIDVKTGLGTDISYCSISNNTARTSHCVFLAFYDSAKKHYIQNSNIIENNANYTIYFREEATLYHCSIIHNGNPCFYTSYENSKIILKICYQDDLSTLSVLGTVSETEKQEKFIHSLPFYVANKCALNFYQCTENSFLRNLYIHKIIIPSPFIFLILSNKQ